MANVPPISIAPTLSLLHQNNIGVTYAGPSNFGMEPIRFVPLYFVAMLKSIIIVIKTMLVSALIHIVDGVRFKPKTPRGTKCVNLHEDIPREVNKFFAS